MEHEKTFFLVDTENIKDSWARLLPLKENEKILLFYSPNSPGVSYSLLDNVFRSQQQMELIACHTGHNAMDFQLVTELGYRIGICPDADYVICSNDQGYDPVCKYWSERNFSVERRDFKVTRQVKLTAEKPKNPPQQTAAVPQKSQTQELPKQPEISQPKPQNVPAAPAPKSQIPASQPVQNPQGTAPASEQHPVQEKNAATVAQALKKTFPAEYAQYVEPTSQIILAHGKDDMAKIYQAYLRKYGQKKGLEVYKKLRTYVRSACKAM